MQRIVLGILRSLTALATAIVITVISIHIMGQLAGIESKFTSDRWYFYVQSAVTVYWIVQLTVWAGKSFRHKVT